MIVDAAQDHVDRLEAPHRPQPHLAVAHGQIGAARERVAEVAREVRVLEVRFIERPGRQEHDARLGVPPRRDGREARAQVLEEEREPVHVRVAVEAREHAAHHDPVLERVAGPRRRLRAIREHPHAAVGSARDVRGIQDERVGTGGAQRMTGAKEPPVSVHELERQEALLDQVLRPVDVAQDQVQELGTLHEPPLDLAPLVALAQEPPRLPPAIVEGRKPERPQCLREVPPVRADLPVRADHLVVYVGPGAISGQEEMVGC